MFRRRCSSKPLGSNWLIPPCIRPKLGGATRIFYSELVDKAAVLTCQLAWNHHPLPDGNKRAAWACLAMFVDLNGGTWEPDPPDAVVAAESAMLAVASREWHEARLAAWLRERVVFA